MTLRVVSSDILPAPGVLAEAAARGVETLVIAHLREKNGTTTPNRWGLPKTNYYAEAANDVASTVNGKTATVEVNRPGIALHYEGGTVYPKKKALAVPIDPTVAGIWPSELGGELTVIWKKGNKTGFLKDPETGDLLYQLLPKAKVPRDETVLPTDSEIIGAASEAVLEAVA